MTSTLIKRIALPVAMLVVVGAAVVASTGAFFSDTETSTGNTFTAGAIDLKIDNESYVTNEDGVLVASPETSWQISDITDQLFFDFEDLKPGDRGEDTISIHVDNNDAYACMDVTITGTPEYGQTEPEEAVDQTDGTDEGELQDELYFAWWADDGDNVYEVGEQIFAQDKASVLFADDNGRWTLADSQSNVWGWDAGTPLQGGVGGSQQEPYTYYVAKYWCYGDLALNAVDQDGQGKTGSNGPLDRGTGFTCNGAPVSNASQTDGLVVDVEFEAIQSRNNGEFVCNVAPDPEVTTGNGWSPVDLAGKDWFAKAKVQEPNPASDFEVQVGVGDSNPADFDQGDTVYPNGDPVAFTLVYDGAGSATFTANGVSTTYAVGTDDISNIGITLRAPSDATTAVSGLSLSTGSLSTTAHSVSAGTSYLQISGASLNGGFTLSGSLTLTWTSLTSNGENQKMQISLN